ncbi:hypothetical protein Pst134EB_012811 [Puccinia striiformis f. sp. tritici]|nr:hypothetical protein Pst134EB_012811 [Puccinia striiformis f. sp. tritici]
MHNYDACASLRSRTFADRRSPIFCHPQVTTQDTHSKAFHHQRTFIKMIADLPRVYFTGDRNEFPIFLYHIMDALSEIRGTFPTVKAQINWIVRHFRYPKGKVSMEDNPFSCKWWIGLLEKNARAQDLPISHTVSTDDKYVLPELASGQAFIAHLKESFGCLDPSEAPRKALHACKQRDQDIQQYNLVFNSLVYAVDLTENERCDIYEEGLDVLLLTTAIKHTGWREAKTLKDKQDLARSAAYIQHKLAQLEPETQNPELQKDQTPEELPNQSI